MALFSIFHLPTTERHLPWRILTQLAHESVVEEVLTEVLQDQTVTITKKSFQPYQTTLRGTGAEVGRISSLR